MDKTLFIADQDSRCGGKIIDNFILNNYRIINTAVNKTSIKSEKEIDRQKLIHLNWNPFSTISPKNIILKIRQITTMNTAAIIFTPPSENKSFTEQSHVEIQKSIDFYFRSQLLLTKEIIKELKKNTPAFLYLVLNTNTKDNMYFHIYKSIINSALQNSSENLYISGVENNLEDLEQFADYFFTLVTKERKTTGKWYRPVQINSIFTRF